MQFKMASNGKLDVIIQYSPSFESADMYSDELHGMRDAAIYYLMSGSKSERKLAKRLLRAVTWIEREIWSNQRG